MKKWQKQWISEIDEKVKPLSKEVVDAPIMLSTNQQKTKKANKRGIFGAITGAVALGLATVTCILLIPGAPSATPAYAFTLEINPKVAFSVNSEGKVTSVVALNEDADTVLANDSVINAIVGVDASDATQIFVDYAAKLGYLDLSIEGAIKLSSTDENKLADIGSKVENYFKGKGSFCAVVKEQLSNEEMREKLGIEETVNNAKEIAEKVNDFTRSFQEREAQHKTPDEIEAMVKEKLENSEIIDEIEQQFAVAIESVKTFIEQNPALSDLATQLDELVANFSVDGLVELLKNPIIAQMFETAGFEIANVPQNAEEFKDFIEKIEERQFEKREEANRDHYENHERPEIDDEDYERHIQDIINEHGSLDNFWENRNGQTPPQPPVPPMD
ncbi:MAG: hypothetical protein IKC64_01680 [Clostridia bacterium]|nr:hypothetical protein [Clostridia bacterium]